MAVQYKNFVEGTLNAAISGTGNQDITVNWATNATVPAAGSLTVSNYMLLVIDPEGANGAPEIVKVTAVAGSGNPYTLTLTERGVGSSSARTHADASKVVAAVTAEQIDNFATKDGTTFTGDVTIPDGDLILGSTAVTSTAAELNILDGCTATVSELNIMDGVTATTSELNIMDGVTSTTSELNILDGVVATNAELNTVAGITLGTVTANKAVTVDANKDVASLRNVTLTGTLTLDSVGITAVTTSGETFADNDTSLLTAGAVVHRFLQYDVDGGADAGATLYIQASAPYADGAGGGVKGDIWIDT